MRLIQHIKDDLDVGFDWPLWLGVALLVLAIAITVAIGQ